LDETNWRDSTGVLSPITAWQEEVNATARPMGLVAAYEDWNTGFMAALSSGQPDPLPLVSPYSITDESHNDRESKYTQRNICCWSWHL
jgi:hypothetical protein